MQTYNYGLDLNTKNSNSMIINMIRPNSEVLEFGPAFGRLTKYISQALSCTVDIVEMDSESGKNASKYARNACVGKTSGNIETLAWAKQLSGNKYDYIIFADVLEHLHNPEDVLKACCDFLKKDGEILCSVPNIAHSSIIISLWNYDFTYKNVGLLDRTHVHFFTRSTFEKMARECGYTPCYVESIVERVGNNEIAWGYQNVPDTLKQELLFREEGDAYQYIFKLKKQFDDKDEKDHVLNICGTTGYVCECKYKSSEDSDYIGTQSVRKRYYSKKAQIYFDLNHVKDIDGLCISFAPQGSLVRIENVTWDSCDIEYQTNGIKINNNVYAFAAEASIYIGVPEVNHKILFISFEILTSLNSHINVLCETSNRFNSQILSVNEQMDELKALMDSEQQERVEENQRLILEISQHKEENTRLTQEASKYEEENIRLTQEVSKYEEENIRLTQEVSKYEEENIRLTQEVSKYEEENIRLTQEVSKYEEENTRLAQDISKCEEQNAKLSQNVSICEEEKNSLLCLIEELKSENEGLYTKIARLEEKEANTLKCRIKNHISKIENWWSR